MSGADEDISVDFNTLQELSGDLERILKEVNGQLDALYDRVEKLVLSWDGDARNMFVDSLDRWDQSMQDLQGAQRWLHDVVVRGHINYDAAHRAVLRGWGGA